MISVGAMTKFLHRLALAFAVAALLAPVAHLLELSNKLRLDGALWVAVVFNRTCIVAGDQCWGRRPNWARWL
jgi:hypothetical protein